MLKINPNIFKAYDIRGIYPDELNPETAEIVGRAFISFLKKRSKKKNLKVVVGRDNRFSSPILSRNLKKGILKEGVDIIDIGQSSTPMFYFAVWRYGFDGGIISTASHNPPQYNGFKIVGKGAEIIGENSGLREIKKLAMLEEKKRRFSCAPKFRRLRKKSVLKDYLKFNLKGVNLKRFRGLKIVIDTGNAVSGILVRELKKYLPCKIYHLFPKLDGNFPNHLPNPLEEKNIKDLKRFVKEKKCDLGMAFDGDGDRVIFVNDKGKMISSDYITCLISQIILRKNFRAKILYNICSSNIIPEVIRANGGVPLSTKVGHTFVKEKMVKEKALFAGEFSGHYYHKDHNFCEAPLFVFFRILEEIVQTQKPISKLLSPFEKYFHSGQINLKVKDKKRTLELLERKYKRGKISHLDGLRVDFRDWWFNARPSNTEDLLRIVVEAKTKSLMKEKLKEIIKVISPSSV
ncbi:phosphomannomutase/phosphoglucomutase [bacterium]|nr:phosphomannomutase/phosphoglucomutase [bacterium]